jgi:serine/threonine-protein kinase
MLGQTLGHYEITEKLGQGGMGEVYRARDTKLNRDVALKLLPEIFANDTQRMGRFSREAQVLASLNHPNIAGIYGLEESGSNSVLVMELVEGEDLSERIARGPITLDEALPIALQIAEALEDAHEKGIIHRDLKPANIKLTPEGRVKVLDFGLAKALEEERRTGDISKSPTLTMQATQAGIILGTAAYMSPEQAKGQTTD